MPRSALLTLLVIPAMTGCSGGDPAAEPSPSASVSASPTASAAAPTTAEGTLAAYAPGVTAVTYDPALAPAGATMKAVLASTATGVDVTLTVTGLKPSRDYGAHVHTAPCGAKATDAGPHLQHTPDPKASASPPSVDPSFANPTNEVWLDLTTDATGAGEAKSSVAWPVNVQPRSVVLHAEKTKTAPGQAGTAGARLACLTVPAAS